MAIHSQFKVAGTFFNNRPKVTLLFDFNLCVLEMFMFSLSVTTAKSAAATEGTPAGWADVSLPAGSPGAPGQPTPTTPATPTACGTAAALTAGDPAHHAELSR